MKLQFFLAFFMPNACFFIFDDDKNSFLMLLQCCWGLSDFYPVPVMDSLMLGRQYRGLLGIDLPLRVM